MPYNKLHPLVLPELLTEIFYYLTDDRRYMYSVPILWEEAYFNGKNKKRNDLQNQQICKLLIYRDMQKKNKTIFGSTELCDCLQLRGYTYAYYGESCMPSIRLDDLKS